MGSDSIDLSFVIASTSPKLTKNRTSQTGAPATHLAQDLAPQPRH